MLGKSAMVVEDYSIIAQAWGKILKKTELFSGIHIFLDPLGIEEKVIELQPALILMDINLPGSKTGIEITRELVCFNPGLKVIILSMHNEATYVKSAFAAGAIGYITKSSPTSEIKKAVIKALNNEVYLCREMCA